MIKDMKIQQVIARCDRLIARCDQLIAKNEAKARQLEAWLNLYEACPELAIRNRHMGIVKHQEQ